MLHRSPYRPPATPSPTPFFLSLNSTLIWFNLLFNSGTLRSLLYFDRLLAFPSLSFLLSPPLSIYALQDYLILPSVSYHSFSLSFFYVLRSNGGGGQGKECDKGRKVLICLDLLKSVKMKKIRSQLRFSETRIFQGQTDEISVEEGGDNGRRREKEPRAPDRHREKK